MKRLVIPILIGLLVVVSGCLQHGEGGFIFFNTSTTSTTSTAVAYECEKLELRLSTVQQDSYAGFSITSYYYRDGTLIPYSAPNAVPIGRTETMPNKCGYVIFVTVKEVGQDYAVFDIHSEPALGWDGDNVRLTVGQGLLVNLKG